MKNKFEVRNGFSNIEFLDNGDCKFVRSYFFRTVEATITKDFEYLEYNARLNFTTCSIFLLLTGPILIILIILTGLNTKKNLMAEIREVVSEKF